MAYIDIYMYMYMHMVAYVYNITAAWAVDREFVIYSFLAVVGPMVPPGSADALGEQKHQFSLDSSRFETKDIDFPKVFSCLRPKNRSPIPGKSARIIVKNSI